MLAPSALLELAIQHSPWLILTGIVVYLLTRVGVGGYKLITGEQWLPPGWYNRAQITRRTGMYILASGVIIHIFGLLRQSGSIDNTLNESNNQSITDQLSGFAQNNLQEEYDWRRVESLIFSSINNIRNEHRLNSLTWNEQASVQAREHARDMVENDYFSHTSLDGETQEERYAFCGGGENLAKTYVNRRVQSPSGGTTVLRSEEAIADFLVKSWMDSDPHRERGIFGSWVGGGVGVAVDNEDNAVYAAMGFCSTF